MLPTGEGAVYLYNYPLMLNGAWLAYVVPFPLLSLMATVTLILAGWLRPDQPWQYPLFDSGNGLALDCFLFLYRFETCVRERYGRWRGRRHHPAADAGLQLDLT